jgi:hypothetical protein
MNQHFGPEKDDVPPFDDAAQEREWLAQEKALRRERLSLDSAGDGERDRDYRAIARALRVPPAEGLPADFAARVAERVTASRGVSVESALMLALVGALAGAAGFVIATQGVEWARSFNAILLAREMPASVWLTALGGCLGATWLMERWQQHTRR